MPPSGIADSPVLKTAENLEGLCVEDVEFERYEAMVFTGLSDAEETLVRNFVPVAVDEAGGFADFYDNATKTNSLLDRLEDFTPRRRRDM